MCRMWDLGIHVVLQSKVTIFKKYLFYLCVHGCFGCINVCVPYACLVPMKVKRGHQTHWNWNFTWLEPPCGSWELNHSPPQEQPVLLTALWAISAAPLYFLTTRGDSLVRTNCLHLSSCLTDVHVKPVILSIQLEKGVSPTYPRSAHSEAAFILHSLQCV